MNENKCKRKFVFANSFHRQIFLLISVAALLPTLLVSLGLYYLIFGVTAEQIAIPESIAYNLIPAAQRVSYILAIATPIAVILILIISYRITHSMVGPFDRIVREMDERIEGKAKGHILIRKTDKFWPLVERINKLIDKS